VNLLGQLLVVGLSAVFVPSGPIQESTYREAETLLLGAGSTPGQLRWAGRILAGMEPGRAGALLRKTVARGTWQARRQVAEILHAFALEDRPALLGTLAVDASWAVRCSAVRTLGHLGEAASLEVILGTIQDPVWSVRWHAIRALAACVRKDGNQNPDPRCLAALLEAVKDPDRLVREEAERVLLALPHPSALHIYLDIFDRQDPRRPRVSQRALSAARALLELGGAEVVSALRTRLRHPNLHPRIYSARILQLLGEDLTPVLKAQVVPDLLAAWAEGTGPVRAAGEALAHGLGAPAARLTLPLLVKGAGGRSPDEIVTWVVQALGNQDPPDSEDTAIVINAMQSPGIPLPVLNALAHALPFLGQRAPRDRLRKAFLEERSRALLAREEGRPDTRGDLRANYLLALSKTAPFGGWKDLLASGLEDPSTQVRRLAALNWIRTSGEEKPYNHLIRILSAHKSDHFGRTFLREAARQGDEAVFMFLMQVAEGTFSKKAKLRLDALNALTSVTWDPGKYSRLILWLRGRYSSESDPLARVRILKLLFNLKKAEALDLIGRAALDPKERVEVRIQAINRLGVSGQARAALPLRRIVALDTEGLERAQKSKRLRLQAAALRALFALSLPEDRDLMLKFLKTGPERPRRLALGALEKIRDPSTRSAVESMTRNGLVQPENRARGLRVLAAIGGRDTAEYLLKRLREENLPEIRLGALDALSLLKPETYVDRLVHYLTILKEGRCQDPVSRSLFAEFLGELGKIQDGTITRFLVEFLLEDQLGPEAHPSQGRRARPLEVAARAALLGHGPARVRAILNRRLREISKQGPGLGIRETFYQEMIRLFMHPSRRDTWGELAVDLSRRILATPPFDSKQDFRALRLQADQAFNRGDYVLATEAFEKLHRLAMLEGYLDRECSETCLADNPIGRQASMAWIARGLAQGRSQKSEALALIKQGLSAAPHDVQAILTAAHATAYLDTGLDWALELLRGLGPQGRGLVASAMARFDLGIALLGKGRKDEARHLFEIALLDHGPLRAVAGEEPLIRAKFTPEELKSLVNPETYR